MDKQEFWKLIDHSFNYSRGDQSQQESFLTETLMRDYSLEQIIEFEIILRQLLLEADDYKVMAAQKIIQGSVTDDSYLYFRGWLIGQGEKTFTETINNPDYLASSIDKNVDTEFELLLYVATTAYQNKTGKDEDETFPREVAISKGLDYDFEVPPTKGTDWKSEDLPKLYPKLWEMFN
jgi:hypothetical protein